jgi:L-serine/L-threonine ammonia-lyase
MMNRLQLSSDNNNISVSKFICSSGGNAGMAVAHAGAILGASVEVFVPVTTMPMMVARLKSKGAIVHVGGANWNEADAMARNTLAKDPSARYIPPFDDPLIWEGHSSLIDELMESGVKPDAVVVSVGGGGLLIGVQRGLERLGWTDTEVIAVETAGAASFAAAKSAGKVVKLNAITSLATSLGALAVTPMTLQSSIVTKSLVVTDTEAVAALLRFSEEYRMLVEPACGAALATVYEPRIHNELLSQYRSVVIVVCGGGAVNLELIGQWKSKLCIY